MASSGAEEGHVGESVERNAGAPEPAEVAIRRLELQFELQKMQLQLQVMQLESQERIALRRAELEMAVGRRTPSSSDNGERGRSGLDNVTQCSKVLKGLKLPCDADVPLWFDEVERVFSAYNVPLESRVHLVMPALTERAAVLNELKLTPSEYLARFETAAKRKDETWAQFASRVGTYFEYYLRSREVQTKDEVIQLVVADRMKASLSSEGLEYVRLREGESWLRPAEISRVLQTFEQAKGKGRATKQPIAPTQQDRVPSRQGSGSGKRQNCYVCRGEGHQARDCPRAVQNAAHKPEERARAQKVRAAEPEMDGSLLEDTESKAFVARVNSPLSSGEVRKSKLLEIKLECAGKPIVAVLDTGSEVTIVKESLVPAAVREPSGKITLVSAFGDTVEAKLVTLSFSLRDTAFVYVPKVVQIVCAITDKLADADCLLSKQDWELLGDMGKYAEPAWGAVGIKKDPEDASVTTPKRSEPYVRWEAPGESYARVNETRSDEVGVVLAIPWYTTSTDEPHGDHVLSAEVPVQVAAWERPSAAWLILCSAGHFLRAFFLAASLTDSRSYGDQWERPVPVGYRIRTSGCTKPKFDPFDPTVRPFIPARLQARPVPRETQLSNHKVRVSIHTAAGIRANTACLQRNLVCFYQEIYRNASLAVPDKHYMKGRRKRLSFNRTLKEEFVLVECATKKSPDSSFHRQVLLNPLLKKNVEKRCRRARRRTPHNLSVIMLGLDSGFTPELRQAPTGDCEVSAGETRRVRAPRIQQSWGEFNAERICLLSRC
ncbi:hypothetical protein MTO96_014830 [Rhipicephalus appendiculatus]